MRKRPKEKMSSASTAEEPKQDFGTDRMAFLGYVILDMILNKILYINPIIKPSILSWFMKSAAN